MVDLILIGAILHFCFLGYRLTQAYERFVDAFEADTYATEEEDEGY